MQPALASRNGLIMKWSLQANAIPVSQVALFSRMRIGNQWPPAARDKAARLARTLARRSFQEQAQPASAGCAETFLITSRRSGFPFAPLIDRLTEKWQVTRDRLVLVSPASKRSHKPTFCFHRDPASIDVVRSAKNVLWIAPVSHDELVSRKLNWYGGYRD